jgi:argininosuccinate lyase
MSENKKAQTDTETILMALDQISQTIDVMTSVVGRLRTYVQEHEVTAQADSAEQVPVHSDQTVH